MENVNYIANKNTFSYTYGGIGIIAAYLKNKAIPKGTIISIKEDAIAMPKKDGVEGILTDADKDGIFYIASDFDIKQSDNTTDNGIAIIPKRINKSTIIAAVSVLAAGALFYFVFYKKA